MLRHDAGSLVSAEFLDDNRSSVVSFSSFTVKNKRKVTKVVMPLVIISPDSKYNHYKSQNFCSKNNDASDFSI